MRIADSCTVEVYDPSTDTWQRAESLPQPMHTAFAAVINGGIAIVGGGTGSSICETMVQWRVDDEGWGVLEGPLVARRGAAAVTFQL